MAVPEFTITGDLPAFTGVQLAHYGSVIIRATPPYLPLPAELKTLVEPPPIPVDEDGTFTADLAAIEGLIYTISLSPRHLFKAFSFAALAEGDEKDLSELMPVLAASPMAPYVVGASAYQLAVADGFIGTGAEWLASLVGGDGDPGASAYDVAVSTGFVGTMAQWLASLAAPAGERVAVMGDSIAAVGTYALHGTTWPTVCELSDQCLELVGSTATGGETTTQIAARIYDTLLFDPTVILFTGGANDLAVGSSLATFQGNVTSVADKTRDAGALFVPSTITPLPNLNAGGQAALLAWNAWLAEFTAARGLPLLDFHALITDGGTGFASGYNSGDNIHPSQVAHVAMANLARATLAARGIGTVGRPERRALGRGNLVVDPMLVNGTPISLNWTWTPATGHTGTKVVDPDFRGFAFRDVVSGAAGGLGQFNTQTITVVPGQRLIVSAENRVDVSTATVASFKGLRFEIWWGGPPWVTPLVQGFIAQRDIARWRYEVDVPAGVTSMNVVMLINGITGAETFTCLLGEFIVRVAGPND